MKVKGNIWIDKSFIWFYLQQSINMKNGHCIIVGGDAMNWLCHDIDTELI